LFLCVAGDPAEANTDELRILESTPSVETFRKLSSAFEHARFIKIYHTPEDKMGRLGYDEKRARELPQYKMSVECRPACSIRFESLMKELSKGLRMEGRCPGTVSTIVSFADETEHEFGSVVIVSWGQCFEFSGQAYFLSEPRVRRMFEEIDGLLR